MAARPNATPSAERQPRDLLVIAAAILAGVQIAVLWLPTLPLGIPGEWQWDRIQYGGPEAATLFLRLFVVLPVVAIYISLCWVSENRFTHATRSKRGVWLISLAIAGFGVLWIVQDSPTYPYDRLGRGPLVLYFPSTSGYFTEAREADDFGAYLAGYESLMSRGDVLHLGTHPPGLIALHRGLLALYERSPMLVEWTLALRPDSARMTEDLLQSLPLTSGSKLSRADRRAESFARRYGLTPIVGADTHHRGYLDACHQWMPASNCWMKSRI